MQNGKQEFYAKIRFQLAQEAKVLTEAEMKTLKAAFDIVIKRELKFLGDGPIGAKAGLQALEDSQLLK